MLKIFALTVLSCLAFADTDTNVPRLSDIAGPALQSPDTRVQAIYQAALRNLDSQITMTADGTAYVSTGDIPAEWLRDSSVQVRPYLFFAKGNQAVSNLIKAVVFRQAKNLIINPYANAFRSDYTVWEDKFELDSLSYPILLSWTYHKITNDKSIFTPEVKKAFDIALATLEREQDHPRNSKYFRRDQSANPVAFTGMIWSGFRPSDDPCQYGFLIPGEMMVAQALAALSEIEWNIYGDSAASARATKLRSEVVGGIVKFGIVQNAKYGRVYAYEVDGLGHYNMMDDGNLPSLLGIPLLGFASASDPLYLSTRKFVLSTDNPYFYSGKLGSGVGSPHTRPGMIWPLALLSQAFTAQSDQERTQTLEMILRSDPGDHLLHESFDPNNPLNLTRKDFGWPNAMFIEYALTKLGGKSPLPFVSSKYEVKLNRLPRSLVPQPTTGDGTTQQ